MEGSGPVPARGIDGGGPPADGLHEGAAFRVPPHNYEAEMALLGALLANNRAFDRVADFLQAEHFADARHGRIYDAIKRKTGREWPRVPPIRSRSKNRVR